MYYLFQCSSDTRNTLAGNILKHVRLAYMSPEELKYIRKLPFVENNRVCTEMLDKAIYFREHPKEQILLMTRANEVRNEPFIVTFGCNDRAMHACIMYKGTWYPLDRALSQPRPFIGAALAVINNFLFVCGGQSNDAVSSCICFNPCWGKWLPLSPMNVPRRNFGLVAHNMHLYAIGGISNNDQVTDTVEVRTIFDLSHREVHLFILETLVKLGIYYRMTLQASSTIIHVLSIYRLGYCNSIMYYVHKNKIH